nr:hypothetical protein [Tanacetum cinerariifolium]
MMNVFESMESDLDVTWNQKEVLNDQLLEATLKYDVEKCVMMCHDFVNDNSFDEIEKVKREFLDQRVRGRLFSEAAEAAIRGCLFVEAAEAAIRGCLFVEAAEAAIRGCLFVEAVEAAIRGCLFSKAADSSSVYGGVCLVKLPSSSFRGVFVSWSCRGS